MAAPPLAKGAAGFGRQKRAALVEILRQRALVDTGALARAELVSAQTSQPVEQVLNTLGSLSDDDLVSAYAEAAGCGIWDPSAEPITLSRDDVGVSVEFLRRARIAPLSLSKGQIRIAACDPLDDEGLSGLVFATGRKVQILVARPSDWRRAFDEAFDRHTTAPPVVADRRRLEREVDQVADSTAEGAGSRLVANVFEAAIASGASDIHFEPHRNDFKVRLRIDGRLVDHLTVSADLAAPAVSRVKVIANLDLGEKRLPQDGRTTFVIGGRQVDVRVATSPTVFGEAAVLRILDRASVPLDLDALGMTPKIAERLTAATRSPHGLFLITGPTGSGKTTTLYALLQAFAGSAKKVLSVEDPVEYHFEHVTQTQVAPQLGLTFATALRSFLRLDPDVILVGEIRDPETAAVAIQAAMTGHFVLASVHANDALAVLPRLQDMGVEPYQLAAAFRGAAAQRLVRRLCPHCKTARPLSEGELVLCEDLGLPPPTETFEPHGCTACKGLGFRGRIAIAEAFVADETLLRVIAADAGPEAIGQQARRQGLEGMARDGVAKVAEGVTTFAEVMAAVNG
ncbi:GspE/PulE family protein [Caulobacter sp. KR2-114]|uniref:GspE/PulE family protein n=1 Tax=Caulobacter sp. KR2-114 TaxID=3400912 RepID=UPI003BFF6DA1